MASKSVTNKCSEEQYQVASSRYQVNSQIVLLLDTNYLLLLRHMGIYGCFWLCCLASFQGVAFGPGYPLILHKALATSRYPLLSLTRGSSLVY